MACAEYSFHVPSLEELVGVLQKGLRDNFAEVHVSVVDCPDLTKEPFTFPVKGICGKTRIAEVGGVPYLLPLVNKKKVYDLNKIAKDIQLPGGFILGAGAGPFQTLGFNSEFMLLVQAENEHKPPVNGSYFARVNPADGGCLLEKYSEKYHDFGCALLANLFASEGQPGKVMLLINAIFSKISQRAKNLNAYCYCNFLKKIQSYPSQSSLNNPVMKDSESTAGRVKVSFKTKVKNNTINSSLFPRN